jgi:hypothetical protein
MKYRMLIGVVAMLALVPSPVLAQETGSAATMSPSSPWNVDYGEDRCFLLRKFGTGEDEIILRITRPWIDGRYELVLAGAGVPRMEPQIEIPARLTLSGAETTLNGFTGELGSMPGHFIRLDVPPEFLAEPARDAVLSFSHRRFTRSLATPRLAAALASLAQCHDRLFMRWGIDPTAYRALRQPPQPIGRNMPWVRVGDYPNVPSIGISRFILTVSPTGQVTDCRVALDSGSPELDQAGCAAFRRRAEFEPALDSTGQPVQSYSFQWVRWEQPE